MNTVSSVPGEAAARAGAGRALDERSWSLTRRVMELASGLIAADNPYLSSALGMLPLAPASLPDAFACDGATLHVDARRVLRDFSRTRTAPVHDLMHVLLHCLLLHPFADASVDARAWDLACDIVVEGLAAHILGARAGSRGEQVAAAVAHISADLGTTPTAERLYHALREGAYRDLRSSWEPFFHVDSHELWGPARAPQGQTGASDGPAQADSAQQESAAEGAPSAQPESPEAPSQATEALAAAHTEDGADAPGHPSDERQNEQDGSSDTHGTENDSDGAGSAPESTDQAPRRTPQPLSPAERQKAQERWNRAAQSMRVDLQTLSRTRGSGLAELVHELEVGAHTKVDYRSFLRQFAVEHEDMRLSDDEFDYVFYTYGLELYGNVPLVEPLEYRNERRIRDFAIVIDTSSSVSAQVVQEFVNTTFDVLSSEGSFFSKTNIHIIQADARVQSDAKICSLADLDHWRRNIKLRGFGGTDFRPAFRYVQELRQAGEFDDLQGLVYFTDGWGIYPERMPPYKCAFVFYDEDHRPDLVPAWALQVVLHPGEFESMSVY